MEVGKAARGHVAQGIRGLKARDGMGLAKVAQRARPRIKPGTQTPQSSALCTALGCLCS